MLDFIELHLGEPVTLDQVAERLGYSPWYCTRQFRLILGMTFRNYVAARRLSAAALELRDADARILDVALRWGFASQEAFNRAFKRAFGLTPASWRHCPVPLLLAPARRTYMPAKEKFVTPIAKESISISISIQSLPSHRFLGIRNLEASSYLDFWEKQKAVPCLDCHTVVGLLESIPSRNGQIGGWFYENGKRGYLYGIEVPADYSGEVPRGMECTLIPASEYVVFHHPAYDFERQEHDVCEALQAAMAVWEPAAHGYVFNDELPTYQRHSPESFGQALCRPVRRA